MVVKGEEIRVDTVSTAKRMHKGSRKMAATSSQLAWLSNRHNVTPEIMNFEMPFLAKMSVGNVMDSRPAIPLSSNICYSKALVKELGYVTLVIRKRTASRRKASSLIHNFKQPSRFPYRVGTVPKHYFRQITYRTTFIPHFITIYIYYGAIKCAQVHNRSNLSLVGLG
jgi:hypothetical protein